MKNKRKDFNKFRSRSNLRERARRELLRMAEETNVGTVAAKIKFTEHNGGYRSHGNMSLTAEGIFSEAPGGYGFVRTDTEERDIFIPEDKVGEALGGDTVRVRYKRWLTPEGEIRTEGRITEVTEQGPATVIGTVECEVVRLHKKRINQLYLIPEGGKIKRKIILRETMGATEGDKVMARLIRGAAYYTTEADVKEIFGRCDTREANYLAILAENEMDTEFTEEELSAARAAASEPISYEGRKVRDEVIFTIDSESAKDLDDAVSIARTEGGYILGVHIADVSHYIKEKTVLDRLAMARGTSVYFTDKVVPMLPESLSNGACSLNPGEEKYTLSAIITVNERGEITDTRIEPSVIKSRIKGIYSEINRIFDGSADSALREKYEDLIPSLLCMHKLYGILKKRSEARGALSLDSAEAEIILDNSGTPVDIVKRTRGEGEQMIEQFMLLANEAVATMLIEADIPCVFRIHEPPAPEKLSEFITFAHNLGFGTEHINAEKCDSRALGALLDEARARGIGEAVSYACLRSMAKAAYSEIHRPHFGLGIKNYCHFTSPIRRLSDLATHRIIHRVLLSDKPREKYRGYAKRAAAAATDAELRAISAERRIEELYKVIYMSDKIGEVYPAAVSSVASFGIFATLGNTCEGLIPLSTIEGDFVYDEKNICIRNKKEAIRLGDPVRIRVEEADISRGKLLFSLVTAEAE